MRLKYIIIILLCILVLPLLARSMSLPSVEVAPSVLKALSENNTARVIVEFKEQRAITKPNAEPLLNVKGFKALRELRVSPAVIGEINSKGIAELMRMPDVKAVYSDVIVPILLDASVPQINADDVWLERVNSTNVTGAGISVCVIDTGVNASHAALAGRVAAEYCYCSQDDGCCPDSTSEDDNAEDDQGHGSHVSGIVASNDSDYTGVAPGANIVAVKVCKPVGLSATCSLADIADAIDWCVTNRNAYSIKVITMSIGAGKYNTLASCPDSSDGEPYTSVEAAVNSAYAAGISVFASAGNDYYTDGIAHPACLANITAVGALNSTNNGMTYNRGALLNLVAPGLGITSVDYEGGFVGMSGTSMSCPHVAGAAALMYHLASLEGRSFTPLQVFNAFNSTGSSIEDTANSGKNYSLIDVLAAFNELANPSITIQYPSNTTYNYNITQFNITVDKLLTNASVSIDGGANQTLSNDSAYHYYNVTQDVGASSGAETSHNATFYVNDTSGYTNSETIYFTVDKLYPNAPSSLAEQATGANRINWTWTEPGGDLNHTEVWLNGTFMSNASAGAGSYNATCLLPSTTYVLSTRSTDDAGNTNTTWANDSAATLADSSGPDISISSPTSGGTYTNSAVTASLTATDVQSIASCSYSLDSGSSVAMTLSGNTCNATTSIYSASASGSMSGLANGAHAVVFSCTDGGGNPTTTSSRSFTVSVSAGGGGGGGGGGSADEDTEVSVPATSTTPSSKSIGGGSSRSEIVSSSDSAVEYKLTKIESGKAIEVSANSLGINKLSVVPAASASLGSLTIKKVDALPTDVKPIRGVVNSIFEIGANFGVASSEIDFKVERAWLIKNKLGKKSIALNRYASGSWSALPTTLSSEEGQYIYYSASSAGFSYFAITGEKNKISSVLLVVIVGAAAAVGFLLFYRANKNNKQADKQH